MNENQLTPKPAVLCMTIEVKRKETGLVETYTLTGIPEIIEEEKDVSNPSNSGS